MNSEQEQINSDSINEESTSPKEELFNSENINENKVNTEEEQFDEQSKNIEEQYNFGWSSYSEITNGRFARIGFLAIILIELLSNQSFLEWAGIL